MKRPPLGRGRPVWRPDIALREEWKTEVDPGPGKLPLSAIGVTCGGVVAQVSILFHFETNTSGVGPAHAARQTAQRRRAPPPRKGECRDEERTPTA